MNKNDVRQQFNAGFNFKQEFLLGGNIQQMALNLFIKIFTNILRKYSSNMLKIKTLQMQNDKHMVL